jgi:hypothetical protein
VTNLDLDDDDGPKKTPRATIVRRTLVALLALACAGGWIYTRWIVKKGTLGERCAYDMHCRTEAPRCLKQEVDADGVCSRSCDTDGDCAPDIKCVKVELDDRDERGRPLEGGYCFPQALLDARKKKKTKPQASSADAGAAAPAASREGSWIDVPDVPGQYEAAVNLEHKPGGQGLLLGGRVGYEVKGSLIRVARKNERTIIDTTTLKSYKVDDERKEFSARQLAVTPGEVKIVKTGKKETIADHECEIWQVEISSPNPAKPAPLQRELCVVKGAAFIEPNASTITPLEKELAVRGVFPFRVRDNDKTVLIVRATSEHPIDASFFTIPKSYKNLAAR